jgi:nucleoid-associated protein YgaU
MGFDDSVNKALEKLRGKYPKAKISATIDKKVVTLKGEAPDLGTKTKIMAEFNDLVKTDNTINQIAIPKPAPAQPKAAAADPKVVAAQAPAAGGEKIHVVAKGESLSVIAKKYYGDGNKYMKIFDANKDQLKDPDKIQAGQKLRIP